MATSVGVSFPVGEAVGKLWSFFPVGEAVGTGEGHGHDPIF